MDSGDNRQIDMSSHSGLSTLNTRGGNRQGPRGNPRFGWRSVLFYWRSSVAVIAAVAVATAILTGALLVGASMRSSLRDLALGRLGTVDSMLVSSGFFRAALAEELAADPDFQPLFPTIVPAIWLPAVTAESTGSRNGATAKDGSQRASGVALWGIPSGFGQLTAGGKPEWPIPGEDEVVLSGPLAEELGIAPAMVNAGTARVTLRFAKPSRLPGDSALGKKRELTNSLVRLKVIAIASDRGLGGLTLSVSQAGTRNAFVSLDQLRTVLDAPAVSFATGPEFANLLLMGGNQSGRATSRADIADLRRKMTVRSTDLGLEVRPVELSFVNSDSRRVVSSYTSLTTAQLVFSPAEAEALQVAFPAALPVSTYLANSLRRVEREAATDQAATDQAATDQAAQASTAERENSARSESAPDSAAKAAEQAVVVPYSMVAGIEPGSAFPLQTPEGQPIGPLADDEIVLNEWTARQLQAAPGDRIRLQFFEPESTHGESKQQSAELRVRAIAGLTVPATPFTARGRDEVAPATFDRAPTPANDPDLTPHVPGMTDSQSIENWDVPFEMTEKIRPDDDDYWSYYRTTPKAFVSLACARRLWSSRFGTITGWRLPATGSTGAIDSQLSAMWSNGSIDGGLSLVPVRADSLRASGGSTPFDGLFLGLSLFIIVAALLLVSLLFRLGLDERLSQVGALAAMGFSPQRLTWLWLGESTWLALLGAVPGAALGIGWAALMIQGLSTWWVAAIGRPFLRLSVDPLAIAGGCGLGVLAALITVIWSIRSVTRHPPARLLAGDGHGSPSRSRSGWFRRLPTDGATPGAVALALAAVMLWSGQSFSGENQAVLFVGGGMMVLLGLLWLLRAWMLRTPRHRETGPAGIGDLARSSLVRNPGRSVLTVSLVAIATFLVVAINAFRLTPGSQSTGGIGFVATSTQPIFDDLNQAAGRARLLGAGADRLAGTAVYSFRVKAGEDASCNNVFQSTRPQVLGVPPSWVDRFSDPRHPKMKWASLLAGADPENPWKLLLPPPNPIPPSPIPSRPIPAGGPAAGDPVASAVAAAADSPVVDAVLDKNTAWYSLKVYTVGSLFPVTFESGETIRFRIVGLLENSLLQGSLLISEQDFRTHFPTVSGYRYFLLDTSDGIRGSQGAGDATAAVGEAESSVVAGLETALSDQGFDARPSTVLLEQFMSVQNTYLSAFQSLGGLGLLLGTAGLGAVMLRNIARRRAELALLRCLGFAPGRLSRMVLWEQTWLLGLGLGLGIVAAMASTLPHWLAGGASIPWSGMAWIVGGVTAAGLLTGGVVARRVLALPVIASLRSQ